MMIKAVCFDLDGVFFSEQSFRRFKSHLAEYTDHIAIIDEVFHGPMMDKFKTNMIIEEEFWHYVRQTLEISLTNEEIFKILRGSYRVNVDVESYVRKIRAAGYMTCLCSNNFITRIRELEKEFAFLKHFDPAIFSYDIGVLKPDIEIFRALVQQCGVDASEIVYSDDCETKLSGARELGIQTCHFKNIIQFQHKLSSLGVCI